MALVVDHVDVRERFGAFRGFAQGNNCVRRRRIGPYRDVLRRHHSAGRVGWIGKELAQLGRLVGPHLDQDRLELLGLELGDDVHRVIRLHLFEHIGREIARERPQDARCSLWRQLGQELG